MLSRALNPIMYCCWWTACPNSLTRFYSLILWTSSRVMSYERIGGWPFWVNFLCFNNLLHQNPKLYALFWFTDYIKNSYRVLVFIFVFNKTPLHNENKSLYDVYKMCPSWMLFPIWITSIAWTWKSFLILADKQ